MAEQKPWWDLGHQVQRANHAFWQHHGYDTNTGKPIAAKPASALEQAMAKPQYSPSQGPLSIEAMTGQPQKPFSYQSAPQQPAKPAGNFWYNNQQVSEADYRRLTAPQPQAVQAPAAVANTGGGALFEVLSKQAAEQKANADQLRGQITSAANPFGLDSEGYRASLNSARNRLVGQTNQQQARMAGSITPMASGLRAALASSAANDNRAAYANIEAQATMDERTRAAGFEGDRIRSLTQLANGDYSGAGSILQSLLGTTINQSNADRGYGLDLDANRRANESATIQNDAARQQLRSYAQQANIDEATYTERLKAKKQEYELAVIEGRAKIWEAENAHWLKPLELIAYPAGRAIGMNVPLPFKF